MTGWDHSIVGAVGARYWYATKLCLAVSIPAVLAGALLGWGLFYRAAAVAPIVVPARTVAAHEFMGVAPAEATTQRRRAGGSQ